ncbi:MAG: hypothetical protein R3268_01040 [Acidiferrobacterales bacterium]|nr:hypothetical protein [Acidiferrobacterales bacterium]
MLLTAAVLFAIAALGGVTLAVIHFRGTNPPVPLAVVHGLFAAAALVVLIVGLLGAGTATLGWIALALFLIAALGGFYMFATHLRGKRLPSPVVVIHGLAAGAAFVLLLVLLYAPSA